MSDLDRGDLIQQEVNPELFSRLYEDAIRGSSSGSDGELSGIANRHRARENSATTRSKQGPSPPNLRDSSTPEDLLGIVALHKEKEELRVAL